MTEKKTKACIQFIRGINESQKPEIKIKRARNGKEGFALFTFKQYNYLSDEKCEGINKMLLIDEEGELLSKDVSIHYKNDKHGYIKAIFKWKSQEEFKRFIRFAQNLKKSKELASIKEIEGN